MSAIKDAIKKQTSQLVLEVEDITALAVIPETKTVVAAKEYDDISFIDNSLKVQTRTYDSVDYSDEKLNLYRLKAISQNTLLGANYNSARQYTIEDEKLSETHTWNLLSKISMSTSTFIDTDKTGNIKAAVAYDYLHLLHDDGSTDFIHEPENPFWGLAVSPDGKYIANGRVNGTVELRNPTDLTVIKTLPGLKSCVLRMAFSPDGKYLAASDDRAQLMVWNLETQEETLVPGWSKIIGLFWFSDSSGFVAVTLSRLIYFYDLETLAEEPEFFELNEYSPLYIQSAVLRDDETLFAFVEKNGIVHIHFG